MYALMIVDMQNDFVKKLSPELVHALAERTNRLIEVFSARAFPIYVVITEHKPDGSDALQKARDERDIPAIKGSAGAQLVEGLTIPSSARFLSKTKYSAFFGTDADQLLQNFFGTLVIAGVNTHACVRASAVDACQRDLAVVIPADCVASYDDQYHQESLRYLGARVGRVLSSDALIREIEAAQ